MAIKLCICFPHLYCKQLLIAQITLIEGVSKIFVLCSQAALRRIATVHSFTCSSKVRAYNHGSCIKSGKLLKSLSMSWSEVQSRWAGDMGYAFAGRGGV